MKIPPVQSVKKQSRIYKRASFSLLHSFSNSLTYDCLVPIARKKERKCEMTREEEGAYFGFMGQVAIIVVLY